MRNTTFWLFILIQLIQGCKTPEPGIINITPPAPGIPLTEQPKVLSFSVTGIPPENISIDHDKREIQVTIPTNIATTSFPASITVSPGFSAIFPGTSTTTPYLFDLSAPKMPVEFYRQDNNYNGITYLPYTVTTRVSGPLEITNTPASLSLETGQPLLISVKNYYDDAVMSNSAVITNSVTGQQYTTGLELCYGDIPLCNGAAVGVVIANFDSDIPYGQYSLEIRKENKRQARTNYPLTVSKGIPYAYDDSYNPSSPGMQNREIRGANLLESDQIELLLKNQTGDQYKLKPASFATNGKSMFVNIPATIKPSQYSVQLIRQGQLVSSYSRMVISRDRSQPAFVSFYTAANSQNPDIPIALERGRQQGFTFVISENIVDVRLKLIPVSARQPSILIDVATPRAYLIGGPDGGVPSFVIPQTTPVGKYKVILQHIMTDKRLVEGEPFERLLEVK